MAASLYLWLAGTPLLLAGIAFLIFALLPPRLGLAAILFPGALIAAALVNLFTTFR